MAYNKTKPKSVYVIRNTETDRIKIGITENIKERLANLQNSAGCVLCVEFVSNKCFNSFEIERKVHEILKDRRYIGEWFNVDARTAVKTVEGIISTKTLIVSQPGQKINLGLYNKLESGIYEKDGKMYNVKYIDGNWDVKIIE